MKRSFALLAALAALASGTTSLIVSSGPLAAQQANETLRLNLFDGAESVDILPSRLPTLAGAARSARSSRGECPRGTITAFAPKGDPLFQEALAAARRDAVRNVLARTGVDISQFYFDYKVADTETIRHDTVLTLGAPRDETPPKLHTSSRPEKGSRVQPGQQIVVTMTARDDATRWESGIRIIELFADSEGGRRIASQPYPPHLPTCENQPPPHTLSATYTVPSDPPPIVRLAATAMDHVNLTDKDIGEFPTGEWYGRMSWTNVVANSRGRATTTANADLALNPDGSGGLTGRLVGSHTVVAQHGCSSRTTTAATIQTDLAGSYTPGRDAMAIRASNKRTTPMQIEVLCPGAPPRVTSHHADYYEFYERALRGLRPIGDGGFSSSDDQERPCEGGTCTTKIELTLRRARNSEPR